jgi:proline dehydrogenase
MAAMEPMVDFGTWVMKSKLMDMEVVRDIVMGFVRHTFYEHFCAGEDALGTQNTVQKLYRGGDGLRTMLVYAVEYASDNVSCDRNLEAFLQTVETAKSLPPSSVSFPLLFTHTQCFFCLLQSNKVCFGFFSFKKFLFCFVLFCFFVLLFLALNTNLGAHLSTRSLQQVRVI